MTRPQSARAPGLLEPRSAGVCGAAKVIASTEGTARVRYKMERLVFCPGHLARAEWSRYYLYMPRIPTGQPRGPKPRGAQAATERITVRFSVKEMEAVRDAAEQQAMTIAVYIADAAVTRAYNRR